MILSQKSTSGSLKTCRMKHTFCNISKTLLVLKLNQSCWLYRKICGNIDALLPIDQYDHTKEKIPAAGMMKFIYLKSIALN